MYPLDVYWHTYGVHARRGATYLPTIHQAPRQTTTAAVMRKNGEVRQTKLLNSLPSPARAKLQRILRPADGCACIDKVGRWGWGRGAGRLWTKLHAISLSLSLLSIALSVCLSVCLSVSSIGRSVDLSVSGRTARSTLLEELPETARQLLSHVELLKARKSSGNDNAPGGKTVRVELEVPPHLGPRDKVGGDVIDGPPSPTTNTTTTRARDAHHGKKCVQSHRSILSSWAIQWKSLCLMTLTINKRQVSELASYNTSLQGANKEAQERLIYGCASDCCECAIGRAAGDGRIYRRNNGFLHTPQTRT